MSRLGLKGRSRLRLALAKPVMATKYVLDGKTLIPPFVAIPGLGGQAAAAIVAAREEGEFTSIDDFRKRTKLGKKVCETLKDEGVLEGLPEGDQLSLF